jgi:hypothetical protein
MQKGHVVTNMPSVIYFYILTTTAAVSYASTNARSEKQYLQYNAYVFNFVPKIIIISLCTT